MGPIGYGRALRARWFPIVAVTFIVTCLALIVPPAPRSFPEPSTALAAVASPAHARFSTTAVLGVPPPSDGSDVESQFRAIAFYLRDQKVSTAFAERIGYTGDDLELVSQLVTVVPALEAGTLTLTGYGGTPQQAADHTTAYILSYQDYLRGVQSAETVSALAQTQLAVDDLRTRLEALGVQLQTLRAAAAEKAAADAAARAAADPDNTAPPVPPVLDPAVSVVQAEYDALTASYLVAYRELARLSGGETALADTGFAVLQPASATAAEEVPPSPLYSMPLRLILGLLLGLALGAALALILEHLGRRISSRGAAERAFRARVLVEVPRHRITGALKDVAVVSAPASPIAAAYRMLRAVLLADQATSVATAAAAPHLLEGLEPSTERLSALEGGLPAATGRRSSPRRRARDAEDARPSQSVAVQEPPGADEHLRDGGTGANGDDLALHQELLGEPSAGRSGLVLVLAAPAEEAIHPIVVANLAASFAEGGREVTVLRLGSSALSTRARADEDESPDARETNPEHGGLAANDRWAQDTAVAGVQTLDWQQDHDAQPAQAVAAGLCHEGVVVLVDAGRVATAEFAELAPMADGVLAVCEYGKTRTEDAQRAADIVDWSHGRFAGVVLAQVPGGRAGWLRRTRGHRSPLRALGRGRME